MNTEDIIQAIKALTEVVRANSGLFGSETTVKAANDKICELIKKL